jgi:hypothetical protein
MLVLSLAAAILAITFARDPRNWFWLTGPNLAKNGNSREIDTTLPDEEDDPLKSDEFRLVRSGDESPGTPDSSNRQAGDGEAGLKFPREWFAGVQDNTVGILAKEAAVYYAVLNRLRDATLTDVEAASESKEVSFAELFNDSDLFRGRFLTLAGTLRRWQKLPPPSDRPDAPPVYEGWFFTEDGGPLHPYHIISVESPPGLPEGDQIAVSVKITGCFLKKSSYRTLRGMNSAPILLVKQPRILSRKSESRKAAVESQTYAAALAGAILLLGIGFSGILWWYSAQDTSARKPIFSSLQGTAFATRPPTVAPPAESTRGGDPLSVQDALRQIANEHSATDGNP